MRNRVLHAIEHRHFADGAAYDRHAERRFGRFHERVAADVAERAKPGAVVLDAGCGTGLLASRIAERRPDVRVIGVDVEPGMIAAASKRTSDRVEFLVADLTDVPLPDDEVDIIVSTASQHHWTDMAGVVSSLDRLLRPGGTMWIYDMRWMPTGRLRRAAAALKLRVERITVRTGRLPIAVFQRLAVG